MGWGGVMARSRHTPPRGTAPRPRADPNHHWSQGRCLQTSVHKDCSRKALKPACGDMPQCQGADPPIQTRIRELMSRLEGDGDFVNEDIFYVSANALSAIMCKVQQADEISKVDIDNLISITKM